MQGLCPRRNLHSAGCGFCVCFGEGLRNKSRLPYGKLLKTYDRFGQTAQVIKKKAIESDAHN